MSARTIRGFFRVNREVKSNKIGEEGGKKKELTAPSPYLVNKIDFEDIKKNES